MTPHTSVTLIGMPGAGKSTVGLLLAKSLGMAFIDTDLLIQSGEGMSLERLLSRVGLERFCAIESRYVRSVDAGGAVIAPGGSVIYSPEAVEYLRRAGPVVFLDVPLETLRTRLGDVDARGVVRAPGQTLEDLYELRRPLYRAAAHLELDCSGLSHEQAVARIAEMLRQYPRVESVERSD